MNQLFISEINTGHNILSYCAEEENFSKMKRGLGFDFITTEDVQKP